MKLAMLFVVLMLFSCNDKSKSQSSSQESTFNLNSDLYRFKQQMTDIDTLRVWFNHSACTSRSYEFLEVTKQQDSIQIVSWFEGMSEYEDSKRRKLYEKRISEKDTLWDFALFLRQNVKRQNMENKGQGLLQVIHKSDTLKYFSSGIIDRLHFQADYMSTMLALYPEYVGDVYKGFLEEE
ncbi:MAG: hypothetical protein R2852_03020 [Bacteroidia bacterium]